MKRLFVLIFGVVVLAFIVALTACGGSARKATANPVLSPDYTTMLQPTANMSWPQSLPADKLQPWESLDSSGRLVSSINLQSQFVPGVERFNEAGTVTDLGEASAFTSGSPGGENVSWAIYRIPMGAEQPGTIAADVNLQSPGSDYYIGVADYSADTWHWYGPYSTSHIRFNVPPAAYTSSLGNLMLTVVAYDGASFDLVGLGVNARDDADTTAPPVPARPWVSPYSSTILVEWPEVVASDLAGYRVYVNGEDTLGYLEGGTDVAIPVEGIAEVAVAAVDISGNESEPSEAEISDPPDEAPLVGQLTASSASGMRGDIISLTASGGETYDWDTDGDGAWDMVGVTDSNAFANTTNMGIIRPRIYAHTADGGFWMGAVSLIIGGNSRPVVSVSANPQEGLAPLDVTFTIVAEDDDGTIAEWHWDMDGDGIYDDWTVGDPNPLVYQFSFPGFYNAKFRVVDNEGSWDVDTVTVNVTGPAPNQPPVAMVIAGPMIGTAPMDVVFDASQSLDADGSITSYEWDLDYDSVFNEAGEEAAFFGLDFAQMTYYDPGYYSATVRVTDNNGAQDTAVAGATVSGWGTRTLGVADGSEMNPSMKMVNGKPAVSYYFYDSTASLYYVRALDSRGSFWSMPVTVDNNGDVGSDSCLLVVNGRPAIAYRDDGNGDLKFVRANDADGNIWGAPIILDGADDVGRYPSLTIINGYPAVSYLDDTNTRLKYIRANDSDGSSWGAPIVVDSTYGVGLSTTLLVVNGNPAISYWDWSLQDVRYVRSSDVNGTAWNAPVVIDSATSVGGIIRMAIINGYPAIAYIDYTNSALNYVHANDVNGDTWAAPVMVDGSGDGFYNSLTEIDGYPAISYSPDSNTLKYVIATNTDGSTWDTPVTLDLVGIGGSSMLSIGGSPSIAYLDSTNRTLRYARLY